MGIPTTLYALWPKFKIVNGTTANDDISLIGLEREDSFIAVWYVDFAGTNVVDVTENCIVQLTNTMRCSVDTTGKKLCVLWHTKEIKTEAFKFQEVGTQ
jgi:hypothetical protein